VKRATKRVLVLAIMVGGLMCESASAGFKAIGAGNSSCGTWVADRQGNGALAHQDVSWVLGFLSGLGYAGPHDPLHGLDANAVTVWVDNYCHDHPLEEIAKAAMAFDLVHPR
jgi:hypothetical protein